MLEARADITPDFMLAVELLRRCELASATEDASNYADYDCYLIDTHSRVHSGYIC